MASPPRRRSPPATTSRYLIGAACVAVAFVVGLVVLRDAESPVGAHAEGHEQAASQQPAIETV